jgi:large subunit ribosomal protein L13
VINSNEVHLSGTKWLDKEYYTHSRYFGSTKSLSAEQQKKKDSTFIIKEAVEGMLPNNKLSRELIMKLKVYPGSEHPHGVQKPEALTLK